MIKVDNEKKLNNIIDKYKLNKEEKKEFLFIINDIFFHDEFQIRMTNLFLHHGKTTLGEHILEDAVLSYKLAKKYNYRKRKNKVDISLCVKIAMMHDLYTLPYQNNPEANVVKFLNKHGFRHPIEAVINSITWFPDIFIDKEDSKIIIDGIIHHMWPFPVLAKGDLTTNCMELKNYELVGGMDEENKNILLNNILRRKINLSFKRCKYKEGKIVSKADKKTSRKQIKNIKDLKLLLTGDKLKKRR